MCQHQKRGFPVIQTEAGWPVVSVALTFMESEESACLLIVGFWFVPFLRNNWGGLKETRVATADVVWSKGTGTSASDLMCGPIKAHATGAISVFLSVSVGCVCLSPSHLTLLSSPNFFFGLLSSLAVR